MCNIRLQFKVKNLALSALAILLIALPRFSSAQSDTCVHVDMKTVNGAKGESVCVGFKLIPNGNKLLSFQFSINYNPNVIKPVETKNFYNMLVGWNQTNVQIDQNRHSIRALWNDPNANGVDIPDTVLFEICFKLIGAPGECSPVLLSDSPIAIEFLNDKDEILCVVDDNANDQIKIQVPNDLCVVAHQCGSQNNTGSITITAFGGFAPYAVELVAPPKRDTIKSSSDKITWNNLPAGSYTVIVKDATGKDTTLNLTIPFAPSINISNVQALSPKCWDSKDGSISTSISGGAEPLIISWSPINQFGIQNVRNLTAGKYTLTVQDTLGCIVTRDFILFQDTIIGEVTIDKFASCGGKDGIVSVRAHGGTPYPTGKKGYDFYWSSNTIFDCKNDTVCTNNMIDSVQNVLIVDSRNCKRVVEFTVPTFGADLKATVMVDSIKCFGISDGKITAIAQAAKLNLPITVNLTDLIAGTMITGGSLIVDTYTSPALSAGTYRLEVIDSGGCKFYDTIVLKEPKLLLINDVAFDTIVSCTPGSDGFIEVSGLDGTGPYQYSWSNTSSSNRISNLSKGAYSVTVTDAHNCKVSKSYTIVDPVLPISKGTIAQHENCIGASDGCAELLFSAGNSPLKSIIWSNGSSGVKVCNLKEGKYYVTLTDSNNCSITDSVMINNLNNGVRLDSFVLQHPSCPNANDGFIILFPKGGTSPYTFAWSQGPNTNVNTGLTAGIYKVLVDDMGPCPPIVDSFLLIDPPKPNIQILDKKGVSCADGNKCDGYAVLEINGSCSDNSILWSSGETAPTARDTAFQLCSGSQFAIISCGVCLDTLYFNIPAPEAISLDTPLVKIVPPSCYGFADGNISIEAKGGAGGFVYCWDDTRIGNSINGLRDGLFGVLIKDKNNCSKHEFLRVRQPDSIRIDIIQGSTLDVSCYGESDGRITTIWTGGNQGKGNFTWTPNVSQDSVLTNLKAGKYTLTVTDRLGCLGTIEYTIKEPSKIFGTYVGIDTPFCLNDQAMFTVLQALGGAGPDYKFTINNGAPNLIAEEVPLFSGVYNIRIYDKNNCFTDTTIVIPDPANLLNVEFGRDSALLLLGDSLLLDGKITSNATIKDITWTPSDFVHEPKNNVSFVSPGKNIMYLLTVTDENGCTATDKFTIFIDNNRRFYAPTVFSPNRDGLNDNLEFVVGPGVEKIESILVFDRWGNQVFESLNPPIHGGRVSAWDGYYKSKAMNPGVFAYTASVRYRDGALVIYRGDITLIR